MYMCVPVYVHGGVSARMLFLLQGTHKQRALPDVDILVATPLLLCSMLKPCASQFGRYIVTSL